MGSNVFPHGPGFLHGCARHGQLSGDLIMAESTGDLKHGIISLSKPHWTAALA
jgi:hypothetical protein